MFGVIAYSTTGGGTALADILGVPRYWVTGAILLIVILWPATTERNCAERGGSPAAMTGVPCPENETGREALACRCVH